MYKGYKVVGAADGDRFSGIFLIKGTLKSAGGGAIYVKLVRQK